MRSKQARTSFNNPGALSGVQFYICKTFGGIANRTAFQPTFCRILPSGAFHGFTIDSTNL